jgi:hypothetical protein
VTLATSLVSSTVIGPPAVARVPGRGNSPDATLRFDGEARL